MSVRFPDIMGLETRWQTAVYEMDIIHERDIIGLEGGYRGIWWADKDGVPWYVMLDGTPLMRPLLQPVRGSRRLRSASPGARRA